MSSQEKAFIKLAKSKKIIKEYDELNESITSLTAETEKMSNELRKLENQLFETRKKKKQLDKLFPAAQKFIKEQEEIKQYEKTVIPYIKDCCKYLLEEDEKSIWQNNKNQILNFFENYEEDIIFENFKTWFEEIDEDTIKNEYNDERIVWLAHTVRIIDLDVEILNSICNDNEIDIEDYKQLGFKIPYSQQCSIARQEEFIEECEEQNIKYWKTSEWNGYGEITVPISCSKKFEVPNIKKLEDSFSELKRPNNKYKFDINAIYYANHEINLEYDSDEDSDEDSDDEEGMTKVAVNEDD